jgi:hypothetical protein
MATYYNKAGDLIVLANTCMEKGKTKKALECMELALQMPDMQDIVAGLQQLNTVEANEIEDENEDEEVEIDESCDDKNMDDEDIEESCGDDEVEDEVDIDVDTDDEEDPEEETASDEDEDIDEDDDEDDAEEDEDIDEARLDEVLCSLRKQYNVTSSIKSSKTLGSRLAALASKAGK